MVEEVLIGPDTNKLHIVVLEFGCCARLSFSMAKPHFSFCMKCSFVNFSFFHLLVVQRFDF